MRRALVLGSIATALLSLWRAADWIVRDSYDQGYRHGYSDGYAEGVHV